MLPEDYYVVTTVAEIQQKIIYTQKIKGIIFFSRARLIVVGQQVCLPLLLSQCDFCPDLFF